MNRLAHIMGSRSNWLYLPALLFASACLCGVAEQVVATGSVSGTVLYADTGKPAAGINLWLERAEQPKAPRPDPKTGEYEIRDADQRLQRLPAKVGADGAFVLSDVPSGSYVVHTYAPPYLSPDGTIFPTSNTAHVATGPQLPPGAMRVQVGAGRPEHITIRLQRGGSIEGAVRSADGAPVMSDPRPPYGIAIDAELRLGENTFARAGGTARTDGSGHYRLEGLAPGNYIVFAGVPGAMVQTATGLIGSSGLPVYAPGTVRAAEATVVQIAGTETGNADLTLPQRTSLHRVEGSVAVNGQEALQHVTVRLYPKGEGGLTAATPLRGDAGFSFDDVPDGEYTLSVEFPPRSELVNVDLEHGLVRMRMLPAPYATTTQDVRVTGQNLAGILLQPAPVKR